MNLTSLLSRRARAIGPKALTLLLTLLAAPLLSAGQAELAASIRQTRDEIVATRDQLQATVNSLDALVKQKGDDLRPAYNAFVAEVAKTQADAAVTKARASKMESEAKSHFGGWQTEIDGINNEKLRKQAQKRMDGVQKTYTKATSQVQSAGTSFAPYLSDLADVTKVLANDLTPGGIKAIRSTVSQAKFDLSKVRSHIFEAVKSLDSMQKSLSSTASK